MDPVETAKKIIERLKDCPERNRYVMTSYDEEDICDVDELRELAQSVIDDYEDDIRDEPARYS